MNKLKGCGVILKVCLKCEQLASNIDIGIETKGCLCSGSTNVIRDTSKYARVDTICAQVLELSYRVN